jgi:hypothetical protein
VGMLLGRPRPLAGLAARAALARSEPDRVHDELAPPVSQYVPPGSSHAPATSAEDLERLVLLASLHETKALSDDEFAVAKARLLGL